MELSVVMPAYMEYENLRILLPRIEQSCRSLGVQFEIVVVGPNKPLDQTPNLCAEFAHWRYVDRAGGNSYGDAVRSAATCASAGGAPQGPGHTDHTRDITLFSHTRGGWR